MHSSVFAIESEIISFGYCYDYYLKKTRSIIQTHYQHKYFYKNVMGWNFPNEHEYIR